MKFKIGDRVKLKKACSGSVPRVIYVLKNKTAKGEKWNPEALWAWNKDTKHCGCSCQDNFILLKKMGKEKSVKYILKYEDSNEDPYEEFATLDEVKKRIEELIADGDGIIMSSVRVYEVKSIAKVETNITFK